MFYASPLGRFKMYAGCLSGLCLPEESNKVLGKLKGNKRVLKTDMIPSSRDGTCLTNGSLGKVTGQSVGHQLPLYRALLE